MCVGGERASARECVQRPSSGFGCPSHHSTAASQTVWADRTGASAFLHRITDNYQLRRTGKQWGMVSMAENNIDKMLLPADWACGRVLSAHLS